MHCSATYHQKDVLDALLGDKADYIVGEFHQSNLQKGFGEIIGCRGLQSLKKTSCAVRPRAANNASINSRTAPLPPAALAIKFARANTTDAAFAGAADNPAMAIA